jgi:hypothetical protein
MSGIVNGRRVASLAFGLTLLAATLLLAPASSHAYGGGRGFYGGGHGYRGGAPVYVNHGGFAGRGWYGGRGFYGGARYYRAPRYYYGGPTYYPRSYVSFGFGLGSAPGPYYYPPYPYHDYGQDHPSVVYKERVVYRDKERETEPESYKEKERDAEPEVDVENEPPAGCFYYDRTCDREFKNLDDYTDHLYEIDDTDHPSEIEIVNRDSDKTIRTLEYVDYWTVKKEKK